LKRSNRLVLLVGVFLAIVAFVGILIIVGNPQKTGTIQVPTTGSVVVAAADIPLSAQITADKVKTITVPLAAILPGAFTDPSQVIGQIARQAVATGAQITVDTLNGGPSGQIKTIDCPTTMRCMAVQVDQVSGVGTVIKTGDYVDMVVGLTGADKFPVITVSPVDNAITAVAANELNNTSVKLLLQGLQVMGTLLPPVAPTTTGAAPSAAPSGAPTTGGGGSSTALNGQQEIVVLAVSAQQTELLKFAQMDGNVTLALRSPGDFVDPVTHKPIVPVTDKTTGLILKTLVDAYGVLPPDFVQTVIPKAK
jgi:Flp pilus assembly protein CpaB